MKKHLLDLKKSFLEGIVLLKDHPEVIILVSLTILTSYVFSLFSQFLPIYIRFTFQFILFTFHLTLSLSIPKLLIDPENVIQKRIENLKSEIKKNIPRVLVFSLVVYGATRFMGRDEYIESYNHTRANMFNLFLDSYYQYIIIAASVYFSIRKSALAQSVVDGIVFSMSNLTFTLAACVWLMPFIFIQPEYLKTPINLVATITEQIGIIFISAWLFGYMKTQHTNFAEVEKVSAPLHESGYPYASNLRRISAALIDISIYIIIFSLIIPLLSLPLTGITKLSISFDGWYYATSIALYLLLSSFFLKGQTVGKLLTGIETLYADGTTLKDASMVHRSALLCIELYAGISMLFLDSSSKYFILEHFFCLFLFSGSVWSVLTNHKQALHDRLAHTVVLQKHTVHIWWSLILLLPTLSLIAIGIWVAYSKIYYESNKRSSSIYIYP